MPNHHTFLYLRTTLRNSILITIVCVALYGIFATGCQWIGSEQASLSQDTTISLEAREWSKKIDQNPNNPEYFVQRAAVLNKEKRYDLAILDYQAAIALDGDKCNYYYELGDTYFADNQTTKALEQYEQAEKVNPNDVVAVFKTAQFLYFVRQFDKSKLRFGKLLNLSPQHAQGHFFSGMLYKEDGDTAAALEYFDKTVELLGADYNSSMQLGLLYEAKGDKAQALENYEKAINTDPTSSEAYYARGLLYQKMGDNEKAMKDYQKTIDANPASFNAYYNAGNILATNGDYKKAIQHFEVCVRLIPEVAKSYNRIGQCMELQGNEIKATENYRKCLQIDPNFEAAKDGLARLGKLK
jgi:tetratricopeptide (TPR) repeat protein